MLTAALQSLNSCTHIVEKWSIGAMTDCSAIYRHNAASCSSVFVFFFFFLIYFIILGNASNCGQVLFCCRMLPTIVQLGGNCAFAKAAVRLCLVGRYFYQPLLELIPFGPCVLVYILSLALLLIKNFTISQF